MTGVPDRILAQAPAAPSDPSPAAPTEQSPAAPLAQPSATPEAPAVAPAPTQPEAPTSAAQPQAPAPAQAGGVDAPGAQAADATAPAATQAADAAAPGGTDASAAAPQAPAAPATPAPDATLPAQPGGAGAGALPPAEAASGALPPEGMDPATGPLGGAFDSAWQMLHDGGPAVWAIAALSVVTLALILWKTWTLLRLGAWSRARSERAMAAYLAAGPEAGLAALRRRPGLRGRMLRAGFGAVAALPPEAAREETARVARRELADARTGLRALELIATAAPLLGLLGTVLGMIAAFRTLQEAGGRADPAMLAGGIWEALLTTAAGMAVAIPASAALTWFESVADRARQDMEDLGARLFLAPLPQPSARAPEAWETRADAA